MGSFCMIGIWARGGGLSGRCIKKAAETKGGVFWAYVCLCRLGGRVLLIDGQVLYIQVSAARFCTGLGPSRTLRNKHRRQAVDILEHGKVVDHTHAFVGLTRPFGDDRLEQCAVSESLGFMITDAPIVMGSSSGAGTHSRNLSPRDKTRYSTQCSGS
jgi:hypothetical protein